jgi:hypothetical protein
MAHLLAVLLQLPSPSFNILACREVVWYDGTVGPSRRYGLLYVSASIDSKARDYHRPRQESSHRCPRDINDMVQHAMGPRGYGLLYTSVGLH